MDFQAYKFETFEGLPPAAAPGQFFGFAKDGAAFVLRWEPKSSVWAAVGFTLDGDARFPAAPLVVMCTGEHPIALWAHAPWSGPIE